MEIGVHMFLASDSADVAVCAQKAESLGFKAFWLPEHTILPVKAASSFEATPDGSIPAMMYDIGDPLIGLARASGVTQTIKLGTSVTLVPEHNPLLQAKQFATLDHVSNGRVIVGIGSGWLKEETEIMGGNFERRWGQTQEAVLAMKELWTKEEAEFHGKFYDFPPVVCSPKPVQKPHPPVYLGGLAPNVFKRVVAWGEGWMPIRVTPEQVRKGRESLDELAAAAGRDPKSIKVNVCNVSPDWDTVRRFEEAGADTVDVPLPLHLGTEGALAALERMAESVLG